MKGSIFFKIFAAFFLIIVLLSGFVLIFSFNTIRAHYLQTLETDLQNLAQSLKLKTSSLIQQNRYEELDILVKELGKKLNRRITFIDPEGVVLADSEKNPQEMENHRDRIEVVEAFNKGLGSSLRYSTTAEEEMLYVAIAVTEKDEVLGILRTSMFLEDINILLNRVKIDIVRITFLIAVFSLLGALLFSKTLAGPIRSLSEASKKVAAGDFTPRVYLKKRDEIRELADNFNYMTERMELFFNELSSKKEQLNNIISSISEGLVVIDDEEKISLSNEGLKKITGFAEAEGKYYWEVIRDPDFSNFFKEIKKSKSNATEIISFKDKTFICSGTYMQASGEIVIIFHDITEVRRLQKIKRDFATNISHELRTPLTALKGFAETLEEAIDEKNRHYVEIIKRHTDRLINIVNDLLILSEVEGRSAKLELEQVNVEELINDVLEIFRQRLKEKGLKLSLDIKASAKFLRADPFRLEQVFINLIDNAIKYTEKGEIALSTEKKGKFLVVKIKDTGFGIPKEQQPRIFERFYVVDKSRSKKLGGTGLGLSIVKHIVFLHGGKIEVESAPGEGTSFILYLPQDQA
jgi:two-component system, OmpR family, phosphate regulon sensor histidine kinase PhoR